MQTLSIYWLYEGTKIQLLEETIISSSNNGNKQKGGGGNDYNVKLNVQWQPDIPLQQQADTPPQYY